MSPLQILAFALMALLCASTTAWAIIATFAAAGWKARYEKVKEAHDFMSREATALRLNLYGGLKPMGAVLPFPLKGKDIASVRAHLAGCSCPSCRSRGMIEP